MHPHARIRSHAMVHELPAIFYVVFHSCFAARQQVDTAFAFLLFSEDFGSGPIKYGQNNSNFRR